MQSTSKVRLVRAAVVQPIQQLLRIHSATGRFVDRRVESPISAVRFSVRSARDAPSTSASSESNTCDIDRVRTSSGGVGGWCQ